MIVTQVNHEAAQMVETPIGATKKLEVIEEQPWRVISWGEKLL